MICLQDELRDDVIGTRFPHLRLICSTAELELINIEPLAYSQIRKKIRISSTRYMAKTAFQAIEAKLARWWLNPTSDDEQMRGGIPQDSNQSIHALWFPR